MAIKQTRTNWLLLLLHQVIFPAEIFLTLQAINPRLLVFVEGTSGVQQPITTPEAAFWGGSLASARQNPVRLANPAKLVYSPHVYGPGK